MKPTFSARARLKSSAESLATFSPSSQISPEVGRSRQPIKLARVDLPDPDGPMTASHSPDSTWRETSSSARTTPPPSGWNGETRRHRGVKIRPPDPDGRPYSDGKA